MPGTGVYSNTQTMSDDGIHRFETTSKKLRSAYIKVSTQNMKLGNQTTQAYTVVTTDAPVILNDLDVSKLYFKNATAGQNGTITIIGTV